MGDFHGTMPWGLKTFVKKNKVDLILSPGDFYGFCLKRQYWKHFYELKRTKYGGVKSEGLKEIVGAKRYKECEKKDKMSGINVLKYLDRIGKPVFVVYGNGDIVDAFKRKRKKSKKFTVYDLKNVKFIDLVSESFEGFYFVGLVDREFIMLKKKRTKGVISTRKRLRKKIKKIFKKVDLDKTILMSHRPPYNTKLDRVNDPKIPGYGKHYGDEFLRKVIERYQPLLNVCGHMHENQGKIRVGKTLVVNSGYGKKGEFVVLDLKGKKINVRFYKSF